MGAFYHLILSLAILSSVLAGGANASISAPPKCFYCDKSDGQWWPFEPVKKDLSKLSYMGLLVDAAAECVNICADGNDQVAPLHSQLDCFKAASN